ncbi:DNA circularization protein [Paraburkholderia sp. BR14263]|uniref:DNA circularization protein n=1 Tax=unclassified Paraburkholderia TaxID=2615204 RepID=UPI0034CE1148
MSVSSLLSFAGSIGQVTSAARELDSILNGSAAASWWSSLRQASYGGVPFAWLDNRLVFGQNNVVHRYPFRDDVWVEPLGKLPRQFEIQGFLIERSVVYGGGSVIAQRDRMVAVCEDGKPKTLVHPTLGTIANVSCLSAEATESIDHGRVIMIRFQFIQGGARIYPSASVSFASLALTLGDALNTGALADFVNTVTSALDEGATVVQTVVNTATSWYDVALGDVQDVGRFFNAVSSLAGDFGRFFGGGNSGYTATNQTAAIGTTAQQLLEADTVNVQTVETAGAALIDAAATPSESSALATAAQSLVAAFSACATDPADRVRLLSDIATYSPDGVFTTSAIGSAMSTAQEATGALVRRTAFAALGSAVAVWQPSSFDEAQSMMTTVADLLDAESVTAADNGDDASYAALRALRKAVVQDLQSRGGGLPALVTRTFGDTLPAVVLAHRIYDDASRADQLVKQVQPVHPLFMPTTFQSLAK